MKIELYIDVLFLIQFLFFVVTFDICRKILCMKTGILRLLLSALTGSFLFTGYYALILINKKQLGIWEVFFSVCGMLLLFAILGGNKRNYLSGVVTLLIISFVIAGGWYAVSHNLRKIEMITMFIYFGIVDILFNVTYLYFNQEQCVNKNLCQVRVHIQDKCVDVVALYDSGNLLVEPYGGRPVVIISSKILLEHDVNLFPIIFVPYYSLGEKEGMLRAVIGAEIEMISKNKYYKDICLAFDDEIFLKQKGYEMILHSSMI